MVLHKVDKFEVKNVDNFRRLKYKFKNKNLFTPLIKFLRIYLLNILLGVTRKHVKEYDPGTHPGSFIGGGGGPHKPI